MSTVECERILMQRNQRRLVAVCAICIVVLLMTCRFSFDPRRFWVIKFRLPVQVNVFYAGVTAALLLIAYVHIEPFFLRIRRFTLPFDNLPVKSFKIAHISDIHMHYPYPQMTEGRLRRICRAINRESPDITVITGDSISNYHKYVNKDINSFVDAIRTLDMPVFLCYGNHDYECADLITPFLRQNNIHVLDQDTYEFADGLFITGITPSLVQEETENFIKEVSSSLRPGFHILLAHMPDAADAASGFDLQLSGHSHGGQMVLPFGAGSPLLIPGSRKYHGMLFSNYRVGNMILHVSRGLGVTPLPYPLARMFCPPEMSILTLTRVETISV